MTDITEQKLQMLGVRLLMLDFDNTIVPYTTSVPTPKMDTWLKEMLQRLVFFSISRLRSSAFSIISAPGFLAKEKLRFFYPEGLRMKVKEPVTV